MSRGLGGQDSDIPICSPLTVFASLLHPLRLSSPLLVVLWLPLLIALYPCRGIRRCSRGCCPTLDPAIACPFLPLGLTLQCSV
eukprot:scaffold54846_cov38-Tisochrysis_lutea.AAC.1